MTTKASQARAAFFSHFNHSPSFPKKYLSIWKGTGYRSNIIKIKALLKDYTKENFFLGSFLGRLFCGHWNRHHISKVHKIIQTRYECIEDIMYDLKLLKPEKGGSLERRIRFIDMQTTINSTILDSYNEHQSVKAASLNI